MLLAVEQIPDVPLEQRKSDELIKRVQKLRWMGLEEEASTTQRLLAEIPHAERVLAVPCETD